MKGINSPLNSPPSGLPNLGQNNSLLTAAILVRLYRTLFWNFTCEVRKCFFRPRSRRLPEKRQFRGALGRLINSRGDLNTTSTLSNEQFQTQNFYHLCSEKRPFMAHVEGTCNWSQTLWKIGKFTHTTGCFWGPTSTHFTASPHTLYLQDLKVRRNWRQTRTPPGCPVWWLFQDLID